MISLKQGGFGSQIMPEKSCAGKAEIDMECEAQTGPVDMGVMLTEFEGRGIPGECI